MIYNFIVLLFQTGGIEIWIPVAVTIGGASLGSFSAVKVAIAQLDGRVRTNEKDIARHEKSIEKIEGKLWN